MNQMEKELSTEERLRAEIEDLKRQLEQQQSQLHHATSTPPSRVTLGALSIVGLIAVAAAFFAGYVPHEKRERMLVAEAKTDSETRPSVTVAPVRRALAKVELTLPGNIQAVAEAPVLARADGYIKKRYADIGDRVKAGQLLAELEAPELDQQVQQARAAVDQSRSELEAASANLEQGKANEELARANAARWSNLVLKGAVSRQENDQYQTQFKAQTSSVQSLQKAVAAARSNVSAAEANLARLSELQGYEKVRAPFGGVITLRNVDVGTLVTNSSTLLYRIAQTNILRTYINVPQSDADAVRVGQPAVLSLPDLPGRQFHGAVTRTANALDPATRTLLVEIQVPNPEGTLLPGTYCQVSLTAPRSNPPLLIPGDTLVVRPDGPQVALVGGDQSVHFQRINLGRDYGDQIEVVGGLQEGQRVVVNPGDTVRDGVKVNPILLKEKAQTSSAPAGGPTSAGH
jgi:multidrug efflux pump subunit AcrA (membrane-fusion protein)